MTEPWQRRLRRWVCSMLHHPRALSPVRTGPLNQGDHAGQYALWEQCERCGWMSPPRYVGEEFFA